MDFPTIVSTAALANNAITAIKNARELLGSTSEPALREQIGAAYDSILDLKGRLLDQDDEIRNLKAQLAERGKYVGPLAPHGFFFQASDESKKHPLCPDCFQQPTQKVSFLKNGDPWWSCAMCSYTVMDKTFNAFDQPGN